MCYYYMFDDGMKMIVANSIVEARIKAAIYKTDTNSKLCRLMSVL